MTNQFKFKTAKGSKTYLSWKNWEIGEYILGKFVNESTDKYKKPSYEIEIIETNLDRKAVKGGTVEKHEYKEGEMFALNHNGSLGWRMGDVEIGDIIRVEYTGLEAIEKKGHDYEGSDFHSVDVQIAIDAPAPAEANKLEDDLI